MVPFLFVAFFVCVKRLVFAPSRRIVFWCNVVQTAPMNTPPPKIRLTITVTPEVHEAFSRLAKASGMSLGRAMGEWLADTLDVVQYTAGKVEEARIAPRLVAQEMHAYALGMVDETSAVLQAVREKASAVAAGKRSAAATADASSPRPVIRGVKSPKKDQGRGGKAHG